MGFDSLVLAPFSTDGLATLRQHGRVLYEPWTVTRTLHDPEELGRRLAAEDFHALIVEADFLFEELFSTAAPLRFAAVCRAALNHVDLGGATHHGVAIIHTPGRNAQAVAELVLALMLALARRVPQAESFVRDGAWDEPTDPYVRFQGRELAGATLGIIGLGQIGRRVARLARGFGMRVLAHDPFLPPHARLPAQVRMANLDDLLRQSSFVSLHVPDTPATVRLLDAGHLSLLPTGAFLVNVTAPAVIDQSALIDALKGGRLGGVALDVHDAHPIPPNSPFIALGTEHNVLLTPHIGGATVETIDRHSRMVVEDLQRFMAGRRPKHLANPDVWKRLRKS